MELVSATRTCQVNLSNSELWVFNLGKATNKTAAQLNRVKSSCLVIVQKRPTYANTSNALCYRSWTKFSLKCLNITSSPELIRSEHCFNTANWCPIIIDSNCCWGRSLSVFAFSDLGLCPCTTVVQVTRQCLSKRIGHLYFGIVQSWPTAACHCTSQQ